MTALIIAVALLTAGLLCLLFIDRNQERRIQNIERKCNNLIESRDTKIRADIAKSRGETDYSDPQIIHIMKLLDEIVAEKEAQL